MVYGNRNKLIEFSVETLLTNTHQINYLTKLKLIYINIFGVISYTRMLISKMATRFFLINK